jgi:hypothetical protein
VLTPQCTKLLQDFSFQKRRLLVKALFLCQKLTRKGNDMKILWVSLILALGFLSSCAPHQLYQKRDLDAALLKYHQSFRWGRLKQAAQYIQPDLQADFVNSWLQHWEDIELHNLEVLSLVEKENGDVVEVHIKVQWIDQSSMSLKEKVIQEVWVRTQNGFKGF